MYNVFTQAWLAAGEGRGNSLKSISETEPGHQLLPRNVQPDPGICHI